MWGGLSNCGQKKVSKYDSEAVCFYSLLNEVIKSLNLSQQWTHLVQWKKKFLILLLSVFTNRTGVRLDGEPSA
jgi:hypothetical protein